MAPVNSCNKPGCHCHGAILVREETPRRVRTQDRYRQSTRPVHQAKPTRSNFPTNSHTNTKNAVATRQRKEETRSRLQQRLDRFRQQPEEERAAVAKPRGRHVACGLCKKDHRLLTCTRFVDMNLSEKYETVLRLHYCTNCLARSHKAARCQSLARCAVCKDSHHTTLHGHPRLLKGMSRSEHCSSRQSLVSSSLLFKQTLIPTASVKIGHNGSWNVTRALINPARTETVIAAELVKKLRLDVTCVDSHQMCRINVGSRVDETHRLEVLALVTDELPRKPYRQEVSRSALDLFENLRFADPNFTSNGDIMVELGADTYSRVIKSTLIPSAKGMAVAQSTVYGWTISGTFEA